MKWLISFLITSLYAIMLKSIFFYLNFDSNSEIFFMGWTSCSVFVFVKKYLDNKEK